MKRAATTIVRLVSGIRAQLEREHSFGVAYTTSIAHDLLIEHIPGWVFMANTTVAVRAIEQKTCRILTPEEKAE